MKLSKIVTVFFVISPVLAIAQFSKPETRLPVEESYLYPISPGRPGSLAGTMGELRSTHFHSGIDIRTNNIIGLPVLASRRGYISRATVSPSGYGNIIYVTHPDGYTTLYAHLEKFNGALAEYIRNEQYRVRAGEIDLQFHEDQFIVKQGDTIAYSGNSGSSSGPHLHFDIRDENNMALNPLIVGKFTEINDNLPPAVEKIALRTLDIDSRINDRFGRFEFYAQRVGSNFIIANPIFASGNIGVEILAKDKLAYRSHFYGGVNYFEMKVDSQLVFSQAIEKVNVAETRTIYTLMNFKTLRTRGTLFNKLYIDDGNDLDFYEVSPGRGKINVTPGKVSKVQIILKDSYTNSSSISFRLKADELIKEVPTLEPMKKEIDYDITENILSVAVKPCPGSENKAMLYSQGAVQTLEAAYFNLSKAVYLIDLRKEIPDSIVACGYSIKPGINVKIPSGMEYKFYSDPMEVQFPEEALYDTLYFRTEYKSIPEGKEIFSIGDQTVPLGRSIRVSIKLQKEYPKNVAVYRSIGNGYAYIGGEWLNGRVNFSTREFGDFTILQDTIPPAIRPIYVNGQAARFKIKDNLSGISSFEANLDGQWLLMNYDAKSGAIWSERLDKTIPLKGDFELTVTDNAGNKKLYKQKIF